MDDNDFSAPPVNPLNSNEENNDSYSAPPQLPLESDLKTKEETKTDFGDNENSQNNNNNENNNNQVDDDEIYQPIERHYYYKSLLKPNYKNIFNTQNKEKFWK